MKFLPLPLLLAGALWCGAVHRAGAASNVIVRMTTEASGTRWVFSPTNLTINAGDSVTWTNIHNVNHDTTAGPPNSGTNNGWVSPLLNRFSGDIFTVVFSNAGSYPYRCRTHADVGASAFHPEQTGSVTVVTMNLAPIISLTNPAPGTSLVAPAQVELKAAASDPDGTVTNVQFLANGSPLGALNAPPFELLTASLAAGNYTFTAVATDNSGLSATSAPVPVFLLTNAVITNIAFSNGTVHLTVLGIAGQTYVFDATTTLTNWLPFSTNVAPADLFHVADPAAGSFTNRLYRSRQPAP